MAKAITISVRAIDGYRARRSFKTLAGARRYAQERVGQHPEMGSHYAVAADGVVKLTVDGCALKDLFPAPAGAQPTYEEMEAEYDRLMAEEAARERAEAIAEAEAFRKAYEPRRAPGCRCSDQQLNLVGCDCGAEWRSEPLPPTKGARYDIGPGDDLYETGQWTEDGEREIGRVLYLIARRTDGAQWAHDFSIRCGLRNAEEAMARLVRLQRKVQAHVNAGGALDANHWRPIDPAYGSEAYQRLDAHGFFRDNEILRAVDQGEHVDRETEDMARFNLSGGPDRAEMA